ncbi:MAG: hypothetical protein H0U38_01440 [Chloroflexia bacterium]|nr:hypothetical protein [Chloroflexia bacterium]
MELNIPEDVAEALGENPDREALEAILLHLVRSGRVSVSCVRRLAITVAPSRR